MNRLFLDFASTTPVHPEVISVIESALKNLPGNPSSIHDDGRKARFAVEDARERVASLLGKQPSEIVFTASATESINTVLKSWFFHHLPAKSTYYSSPAEHHATLLTLEYLESKGAEFHQIQPDRSGIVHPFLPEKGSLVSLMAVNNELGSILPSETIQSVLDSGASLHIDAVQALGKIDLSTFMDADYLSFSGHKFYGPRGVGLLVVKSGSDLEPLLHGGAQERNRRSGTEPTALILGFAKALELAMKSQEATFSQASKFNNYLRNNLKSIVPEVQFNSPDDGSPFILNFTLSSDPKEQIDSEAVIMGLDAKGISVSSGSACSSGSWEPSHVLKAIGKSDYEAQTTLRVSFGHGITETDLDRFTETLDGILKKMKLALTLL